MAATDKFWQLDDIATLAAFGGLFDGQIGAQQSDLFLNFGAQLFAGLAERIPDSIPSRISAYFMFRQPGIELALNEYLDVGRCQRPRQLGHRGADRPLDLSLRSGGSSPRPRSSSAA